MPRPIWNGNISFGLLNVPAQLFSGERSASDISFRMLDSRDNTPIRYERVNAETGKEVEWKDIVKGYEYEKGSFIVIDEDELRKAAPDITETVEIEAFVDRESIDPRFFEKPYYLVPAKKAEKGYVLLREILKRSNKVGVARVVIRTRQYLAALMPLDDALVLDLMRFPDELVDTEEFKLPEGTPSKFKISPKELEMGEKLIESMTTEWKPEDYKDDFRQRLRKIIDAQVAKKSGKKVRGAQPEAKPARTPSNVIDFTSLLKKSLEEKSGKKPARETREREKPAEKRSGGRRRGAG